MFDWFIASIMSKDHISLNFSSVFITLPSNCLRADASATIGLSHHYNGGNHLIIISANAAEFSITLRANVTQNSSCGNVFPFASVLPSDYSWNHFWILSVMGGLIKTNIRIRLRRSVFKTKRSQNCDVEPFSSLLALDFATMCRSSVLLWRIFLDRLSREFPRLSGWTLRDHSKFLSSWQFYLFLSVNQRGICHWVYPSVDINDTHI